MLGMELRLESRALHEAIDATTQFFKNQRVVACCGDRLTLDCLCLAVPIRRAVVGAAPPRWVLKNCAVASTDSWNARD